MRIERVGVVGCGTMGGGIAQVCARAGYPTHVHEATDELLQGGLGRIRAALQREVDRDRLSQEEMDGTLARMHGTTTLAGFETCDLVIEAVVEDPGVKRGVFADLDRVCPEPTLLASNTSSLPIMEMAAATGRQSQVLGLHFFNPAPVMKLVEVIATVATSEEAMEAARGFVESLGKTPVRVKDSPGFVVNRLLAPYLLDAIRVYDAGLATREDIDQAVALGLNHPMGPLALADLIGLDVLLSIAESMHRELGEARLAAPPLLRRMVVAGRLGRKTGRGFYEY